MSLFSFSPIASLRMSFVQLPHRHLPTSPKKFISEEMHFPDKTEATERAKIHSRVGDESFINHLQTDPAKRALQKRKDAITKRLNLGNHSPKTLEDLLNENDLIDTELREHKKRRQLIYPPPIQRNSRPIHFSAPLPQGVEIFQDSGLHVLPTLAADTKKLAQLLTDQGLAHHAVTTPCSLSEKTLRQKLSSLSQAMNNAPVIRINCQQLAGWGGEEQKFHEFLQYNFQHLKNDLMLSSRNRTISLNSKSSRLIGQSYRSLLEESREQKALTTKQPLVLYIQNLATNQQPLNEQIFSTGYLLRNIANSENIRLVLELTQNEFNRSSHPTQHSNTTLQDKINNSFEWQTSKSSKLTHSETTTEVLNDSDYLPTLRKKGISVFPNDLLEKLLKKTSDTNSKLKLIQTFLNFIKEKDPVSKFLPRISYFKNKTQVLAAPTINRAELFQQINSLQNMKTPQERLEAIRTGSKPELALTPRKEITELDLQQFLSRNGEKSTLPTLKDIIGHEDVKEYAEDFLSLINHPHMAKILGSPKDSWILFEGPPGTGKTVTAQAIAHYFSENDHPVEYIAASSSQLGNARYIGESADRIHKFFKDVLEKLKEGPALIFFDEIDTLIPKRPTGSANSSADKEQAAIVNAMIENLNKLKTALAEEGNQYHHCLIIGATNRPDTLDDAIISRAAETFRFDPLNSEQKQELLNKKLIQKKLLLDPDDLTHVADLTKDFSDRDIVAFLDALQRRTWRSLPEQEKTNWEALSETEGQSIRLKPNMPIIQRVLTETQRKQALLKKDANTVKGEEEAQRHMAYTQRLSDLQREELARQPNNIRSRAVTAAQIARSQEDASREALYGDTTSFPSYSS